MIDATAIRVWTFANMRARDAYYDNPITSVPVCEACGRNSSRAICPGCRVEIEEKP